MASVIYKPFQPDPREFAGELTIHDFSTYYPNTNKTYAFTNKELEIRAKYQQQSYRRNNNYEI